MSSMTSAFDLLFFISIDLLRWSRATSRPPPVDHSDLSLEIHPLRRFLANSSIPRGCHARPSVCSTCWYRWSSPRRIDAFRPDDNRGCCAMEMGAVLADQDLFIDRNVSDARKVVFLLFFRLFFFPVSPLVPLRYQWLTYATKWKWSVWADRRVTYFFTSRSFIEGCRPCKRTEQILRIARIVRLFRRPGFKSIPM